MRECNGTESRTSLSIREHLVGNVLSARVEARVHLRDHVRAHSQMPAHVDFLVKVPDSAGQAHVLAHEWVEAGWIAEDCRIPDQSDWSTVSVPAFVTRKRFVKRQPMEKS